MKTFNDTDRCLCDNVCEIFFFFFNDFRLKITSTENIRLINYNPATFDEIIRDSLDVL